MLDGTNPQNSVLKMMVVFGVVCQLQASCSQLTIFIQVKEENGYSWISQSNYNSHVHEKRCFGVRKLTSSCRRREKTASLSQGVKRSIDVSKRRHRAPGVFLHNLS